MAKTFTLKSVAYQGRYLQLDCVQETNIAKNQSTINWTLSSLGGEDSYYQTGPTTVTIAGSQVYYCKKMTWDTRVFPAAKGSVSGSLVVNHDTYGNLTIYASLTTSIYTGVLKTADGNWTLDNIPRGATITGSQDFNDTQIPTVTYSNPAGDNVEELDICIADDKGMNAYLPYREINRTGSLSYTFTADDVTTLKNITGNSLKLTFVIRTKIGGNYLYSSENRTFTVTENDDTKPVVSMSVSPNNGSLPSKFDGLYIQRKTRVDVNVSAYGKYNASISSYSGSVDGKAYSSDKFTSDALQNPGNVKVYGYAKDSRGFTGSKEEQIQVIEYSKPLVVTAGGENAILCYRSDGNGKRTGNSTSVWIKAARSYHKVVSDGSQKNFCALQWRRKRSTEAWNDSVHQWSDLIAGSNLSTDQYNALLPNVEFDLTKAYTVQIRAIDDLGEHDPKTLEVPTQDVALHLGKGGKNVSIGTYCDYTKDYTFYSEWIGIFGNGISGTLNNQDVTDVLTFPEKCIDGLTPFLTNDSTNKETLPNGNYGYSVGFVHKRAADQYNVLLMDYHTGKIAINVYLSGTWTGWKYITPQ